MSEYKELLRVEHVSNVYRTQALGIFGRSRRKEVLDDVSMTVHAGEIFGLVGESGCGKTTLGRAILGVVDYEGEIYLDSELKKPGAIKQYSRKIQAVFQDPSGSLNPVKRVGWLLEEPLRVHKIGNAAQRERQVDETLELVGLDASYKPRKVTQLSGGQKQRVAIAMALMLKPRLIIADEPVSALDVSVGAQILNLLRELHDRLDLSMLFISHNLDVVHYLCDSIAVMKDGRIVESGEASEIYSHPQHEYTKQLLSAIPKLSD